MKKGLLIILLALIFAAGIFAQSFKLYYKDALLAADSVISVDGYPDAELLVLNALNIANLSQTDMNVKCVRLNIETIPGSENSFRWGWTGESTSDSSDMAMMIRANGSSDDFEGHYIPHGNSGITKVKYVFYDEKNPADKTSVQVHYNAHTAPGIDEKTQDYSFSNAYPNPANTFVSFTFDFQGTNTQSSLMIYDLLGSPVKTYNLTAKAGELKIDTSELKDGIYFYSLVMDHKTVETHKLFVKHS